MDFTIDRSALLKPLGHIYSVVERRNTIPILSNVLIETNSSKVSFTATDTVSYTHLTLPTTPYV